MLRIELSQSGQLKTFVFSRFFDTLMLFLAMDNLARDMNRMGKLFLGFTTLVTCDTDMPDAKSKELIPRRQRKQYI